MQEKIENIFHEIVPDDPLGIFERRERLSGIKFTENVLSGVMRSGGSSAG